MSLAICLPFSRPTGGGRAVSTGVGHRATGCGAPRAAGIAVDSAGNVYVTDSATCFVQKFNANGEFIDWWGGKGAEPGQLDKPGGIAVDGANRVYVLDTGRREIVILSRSGEVLTRLAGHRFGLTLEHGRALAVGPAGRIYVLHDKGRSIARFR